MRPAFSTRRDFVTGSLSVGAAALSRHLFAQNSTTPGPIAATEYGKVRGLDWRGVYVFRGIPYGGPTEGSGRFLPPVRPIPWTGIKDATENGPRCIQDSKSMYSDPVIGPYFRGATDRDELVRESNSENCLVLNILTPGLSGRRPVMIYIHGGGFSTLSSEIVVLGDALPREEDVVLVGINHRLSAFGYLYLGGLSDKYQTGNVGQLDLVLALEWIRDNIANFGGDPQSVTLFGVSGGGGKLNTLMAMPAAKGLFHRAIIESGSVLRAETRDEATETARMVMAKLGLAANQVDELQKVPAQLLFEAAESLKSRGVGPVVDGISVPNQIWDPTAPSISADIPLIIGNCQDESTLFVKDEELFHLDEAGLRAQLEKAGIPVAKLDSLLAAYHRDHPRDTPSDLYFRISADRGARWCAVRQAELQIAQRRANVYLYNFVWAPPIAGGKFRAFHTAEHPLSMRIVFFPQSDQLSKQISGAWSAFARHGSPNRSGLPHWPAFTTAKRTTMIFDLPESRAIDNLDHDERLMLLNLPSGKWL